MAVIGASESQPTRHRLKQEIQRLGEQQIEALRTAMFMGMTPDEAQEYDKRGSRISKLVKKLVSNRDSVGKSRPQ